MFSQNNSITVRYTYEKNVQIKVIEDKIWQIFEVKTSLGAPHTFYSRAVN
jgi:hypothetical protein